MPLEIAIIGAGLVGLGAAIALGQQGHTVNVYEKSRFSHEVGAALHVGPMAQRCLSSWGINIQELEPVEAVTLDRISITEDQSKNMHLPMSDICTKMGIEERQLMVHRVDLHQMLLRTAEAQPTVTIHLGAGVKSMDSEGTFTLEDDRVISADVIVGSDGVHSIAVQAVDPSVAPPQPAEQTMYRFLIPTPTAQSDPVASTALSKWVYADRLVDHAHFESARHVVIYACRNNTLLNGVVMLPISLDPRADELADAWNNPGKPEDMLRIIHDFPSEIKGLVSLAEDVKHWRSVNRDCPRMFHKERLVLIGDSAHPMKPTYGAGAGIGIEDAAALGLLFRKEVGRDDVEGVLQEYNRLRYERGVTVKYASEPPEVAKEGSELPAKTLKGLTGGDVPENMIQYILGEDALERARESVGKA